VTDLLFIRHGEAEWNRAGILQGWSAGKLTQVGQRQARDLAACLAGWSSRVTALYTSPLQRAWATAQPIASALGVPAQPLDSLREMNFGQATGLTLEQVAVLWPDVHARWQQRDDLQFRFPGGERRAGFLDRVAGAVDAIVDRHPGEQTVALVAHGGSIRAALAHLLPQPLHTWWKHAFDNGHITWLRVLSRGAELVSLNQTPNRQAGC
jgi:broad specificity phosphatase PhoE